MGFEAGRRRGNLWEDAKRLDRLIKDFPFNTTEKSERDFETGFATTLMATRLSFKNNIITQIDKSSTVRSVYCFGKKHRPDLTFNEDGIAIEIKFVSYAGLTKAIGQGYLYRLQYKFVFLILVISEERKRIYEDLNKREEKDLEDTLRHLAKRMNIFTYVVPAFNVQPGIKKCIPFFE